jgi:hypothetical protein
MPDTPFAAGRFLADYGIEQGTPSRDYLNCRCDWCGGSSTSPHPLGIHKSKGFATCWRCGGGKPLRQVVQRLTGCRPDEVQDILDAYAYAPATEQRHTASRVPDCHPPGEPLTKPYRDYLATRGFDPDWIALEHGVLAAGPRCHWDAGVPLSEDWKGQWFSERLIIPIHDHTGKVVNFQGRTIRKDELIRYKGARVDKVPMHHKHLLYGEHRARRDLVVVGEGVMDQWKLGRGVVATFGTSLTVFQVLRLSRFRRVLFAFDSEPEAQAKAIRWAKEVAALGTKAEVVDLELGDRDAGDLTDKEAGAVRRELGLD